MEFFQSKTLTRDYQSHISPHLPILNTLVSRRSWRKYENWQANESLIAELKEFISLSILARSCREEYVVLETNLERVRASFKSAYRGLSGKINPWLPKTKPAGALYLCIDRDAAKQERPVDYAYPSMVAQDVELWLAERSLGSCWLAGINGPATAKSIGLSDEKWVPAMVVFGKTHSKPAGMNFDNLVYQQLSRKRKRLTTITYKNYYGNSFELLPSLSETIEVKPMDVKECLSEMMTWKSSQPGDPPNTLQWELLAEAGRIAPSASNVQPWMFVLIDDKTMLQELTGLLHETDGLSAAVIGLGKTNGWRTKGLERPFWMIDLPIAFSQISLMAVALGFHSNVFINIPEKEINLLVKAKDDWRVTGVVGIR